MSLKTRLALGFFAIAALAAAVGAWLGHSLHNIALAWAMGTAAMVAPLLWLAGQFARPIDQVLRALRGMVASYREGDFSLSLVPGRNDALGQLMEAHNGLAHALRAQRAHLVQRELLLDTVMQNSPVALVLVGASERVAYANLAARHLLSEGRSLVGVRLIDALASLPSVLREATAHAGDSLLSVEIDGVEETFHLSQRAFILQGVGFRLYLLKRLTRELSRQEVSTWKKLIRVLSHEINNSLGPLSSLAHTGAEIARRRNLAALPAVFAAIAERAEHLHHFVGGYATFAKLPVPRPERVAWRGLIEDLAQQYKFSAPSAVPETAGWFDRVQVEQALINLLKNAYEAGGAPSEIELHIRCDERTQRIEVCDRGAGMTQAVLAQALLPFYSTKRSGTGLGLALAREIAEAHGGRIYLSNREGGGLSVTLDLPYAEAARDLQKE